MLVRLSRGRRAGTLAAAVGGAACLGGGGASVACAAPAERAFALSDNQLLTFDPAAPSGVTTKPITGITAGETLVGIDVRPQNGMLYGLGVNAAANTATLYVIGRETGQAGVVGTASSIVLTTNGVTAVDLPAGDYGFDVNPATTAFGSRPHRASTSASTRTRAGRSTVTTGATSGSVTGANPDGALNGATTSVGGAAYTNDQPNNGNITTLYTLSAATDQLSIQNPPNAGTHDARAERHGRRHARELLGGRRL